MKMVEAKAAPDESIIKMLILDIKTKKHQIYQEFQGTFWMNLEKLTWPLS